MPASAQLAGYSKRMVRETRSMTHGRTTEVIRMDEDKLIQELAKLIEDMGFDYDRFSVAGQETYDKICSIVNKLLGG